MGIPLATANAEGGADSPEALADDIVNSINDADAARLAALVAPDSSQDLEAALESISASSSEIESLQITNFALDVEDLVAELSDGADTEVTLAAANAAQVELSDLGADVEESGSDAVITLTSGEVEIDIDGDVLDDDRRALLEGASGASADIDLADLRANGRAFYVKLAAVERDGRWYLSLPGTAELLEESV